MKKFFTLAMIGLSLVGSCLSLAAPAALAASTPGSGQALEIAPPLITLTVDPGQTITTQIKLRDVAKNQLLVTNQINDFVAAGENGTPKILTGNDTNNPFSLKNWISPLPALLLSPQQIKNLSVTIHVPNNASPGGHYGVIRFTGTPPQLNGTGVSLSASLGSLVLLTVSGKLTHSLTVQQFATTKVPPTNNATATEKPTSLFESQPINFVVKLKNNGNVQEEPTGRIIITNMFGKIVAGVNVNLPPRNVLPSSIREFTASLDKSVIGNKRLFGRYHAALTVNYGLGSKITLTDKISFWVIPYKLIAIIIILLIGGFFVLRYFIRHYNRRIISKAAGSGAQSNQPKKSQTSKRKLLKRRKK